VAEFAPGDVVVLKSGSMRMLVESVDGDSVAVVWANDGGIGRDTLPAFALNRWEHREERPAPRAPRAPRGDDDGERPKRSYGERPSYGDKKPYGEKKAYGDKKSYGERKTAPKTGMDGKPKSKTFFRKEE
jgi:uncharacterized protein YodC (DUF2158 family)